VYKIAGSAAQLANCILLHAKAAIPSAVQAQTKNSYSLFIKLAL